MTTITGTIKAGGFAIAASYFPADWAVVDVDYDIDGDSWSLAATAAVQSNATFSIDSPDSADREIRLIPCQPFGKSWKAGLPIAAGDYVHKSTGLDGVVFRAGGSGTTGGSEPTWDTTHGNTTADNGITWTTVEYLSMSENQGPHIHLEFALANFVLDTIFLLHFDGSDGSTTTTDSGPNTLTVTVSGDAQLDTAIKKYGTASLLLDGSGDFISWPNHADFAVGTGDFTIEFWMYSTVANNDKFIIGGRSAIGTMHITTGGFSSTAGVIRYVGSATIAGSTVIDDSTWHHIAIVRHGGTVKIYVDGVEDASGSDSTDYTDTTGTWYLGRNDSGSSNYLNAQIDDLRFVSAAVYKANFSPPSSAHPDP